MTTYKELNAALVRVCLLRNAELDFLRKRKSHALGRKLEWTIRGILLDEFRKMMNIPVGNRAEIWRAHGNPDPAGYMDT